MPVDGRQHRAAHHLDLRAGAGSPYRAARALGAWAAEHRGEVHGRLLLAGHSPEAIERLSARALLDAAETLQRERARRLDDKDFLRRLLVGGEPAYAEAELERALEEDDLDDEDEPDAAPVAVPPAPGAKVIELAAWVQHANRVIDEAGR